LLGDDAPAEVLDQVGGLGEVLGAGGGDVLVAGDPLADVDGDDVGALLRQPHRVRATLTARRAGHERDLALNSPTHVSTSSWSVDQFCRSIRRVAPSGR